MWFFKKDESYERAIDNTKKMVRDETTRRLASKHRLDVLDLTWEDTARFEGSCVGPNISDMTIQIQHQAAGSHTPQLSCMPVIRHPNFADRTADISIDRFGLYVGNESGAAKKSVSLAEYLGDLRRFLSDGSSWGGRRRSLLADDTHVLVSAQSCFLPVPREGTATFNPVVFNYQSHSGCPAVLAIVATREGTSATIIDNTRDGFSVGQTWGQRLFFNDNGERASFTGERISDYEGDDKPAAGKEHSLNAVMLIQVPLVQPEPSRHLPQGMVFSKSVAAPKCRSKDGGSDVEAAVIGHGDVEGPFTEIDGVAIERDPRFPIRVTVQLYRATATGEPNAEDMRAIAAQIDRIYSDADFAGSLVVDPNRSRRTAPDLGGDRSEPMDWWEKFWRRYEMNTGQSREAAMRMLWRIRKEGWTPNTKDELLRALGELD